MAQPYDLTGFAGAQATVDQMVADQNAGRVKFSGGSETWLANPTGTFTAILAVGGGLVPTTTNAVRAMLTALRVSFDMITAAAGTVAETAVATTSAAVPGAALEAGCKGASGPLVYIGVAQGTDYDLSGIAALQTTANAMTADQQSGATNFAAPFQATLVSGGGAQSVTMQQVRAFLARLSAAFALLAQ
jgi:hypothetical protein